MEIEAVPIAGLGNTTYLLASQGDAVAVDPPRDAWRLVELAESRGWRIRCLVETHVHNDYLSGAKELRRTLGAGIAAPARGRYRFPIRAAEEGHRVEVGDVALVARDTPGHTPEHLSWEVQDASGRPLALFSGGSLLMAGVGRTDLLGLARTPELTAAQFRTMRRLDELPDDVHVYPTHGAGSFCVAGEADRPSSATIGALRTWNQAFRATDERAFEAILAEGRTLYPAYYRRMAPINRRGPRLLGGAPQPALLPFPAAAAAREGGAWLVDVRPPRVFASQHVKGSLNVDLRDSFAGYVGWMVPFDAPIVLIARDAAQAAHAAIELLRIGYEHVMGYLPEGAIEAWAATGRPVGTYAAISPEKLRGIVKEEGTERVLDVRQPYEWQEGAIAGSRRIFVADLPAAIASLDRDATWTVACKAGTRAAIAASLLDAADVPVRVVIGGGVPSLPPDELVRA
jgi:hydroxyacylglutathione hydrolase